MLEPKDYGHKALFNEKTRGLMAKCTFEHGGKTYDDKYPEGIPTSLSITLKGGKKLESGFIMFPSGHSRNKVADLKDILTYKNNLLGKLALTDEDLKEKLTQLDNIESLSNRDRRLVLCLSWLTSLWRTVLQSRTRNVYKPDEMGR